MKDQIKSYGFLTLLALLLILLSMVPGVETLLFGEDSLTLGSLCLIMFALCLSDIACILRLNDKNKLLNNRICTLEDATSKTKSLV